MAARRRKKGEDPEQTKPDPKNTKVENFTRDLKVTLTPEQVAERADRAAQLLADRDHEESELKAHTKHVKSRIARIESEMRHLSEEVRSKCTYQEVECERRYLYDTSTVVEVRLDTGEVVSERPMTEAEKQRDLPFGGGGDLDDDFSDEEEEAAQ